MNYNFAYQGVTGRFTQSPWTGAQRLFINGQEISKTEKEWLTPQGWRVRSLRHMLLFPKLVINGEDVILVRLAWWEWLIVFSPAVWFLFRGLVPSAVGTIGVYLNASLFASHDIPAATKVMFAISLLVTEFVFLVMVAMIVSAMISPEEIEALEEAFMNSRFHF